MFGVISTLMLLLKLTLPYTYRYSERSPAYHVKEPRVMTGSAVEVPRTWQRPERAPINSTPGPSSRTSQ